MAKLELNPYVLSSLDNYVVLDNTSYVAAPYVEFVLGNSIAAKTVTITIEDGTSDAVVITGAPGNEISSKTFNTTGSLPMVLMNLFQCLRKNNQIFYDVQFYNGTGGNTLRAKVEQSKTYQITSSSDVITVNGTFASWQPYSTSYQLYISGTDGEVVMEKNNNIEDIPFNVTSPFRHLGKYPYRIYLSAMKVDKKTVEALLLNNSVVYILPSSVNKYHKWDYNRYLLPQTQTKPKDFLTNNFVRKYNYGEPYCLSMLTEIPSIERLTLVKKYYTNSGMFLTKDDTVIYKEMNGCRADFYDIADIESVEAEFNHSVGYFTVEGYNNGALTTNPIKFIVEAKCAENDVIMFVNSIGGLDSFNFEDYHLHTTSIDERYTYNTNNNIGFNVTQDYERIWGSNINDQYTSGSYDMDVETIEWLNELKRSRYTFKFNGGENPMFTLVTIDDFTTESLDLYGKGGDVECTYHYSDASNENVI